MTTTTSSSSQAATPLQYWPYNAEAFDSDDVLTSIEQEVLAWIASSDAEEAENATDTNSASSSIASASNSQVLTTTTSASTGTPVLPTDLPPVSKGCSTSSLVNCQWIYKDANGACPSTTELLPSSCTAAPPTTTTAPPPPPPPPPTTAPPVPVDTGSPACKTCQSNLGASTCKASDNQCLVNQFQKDADCQACKINCDSVGIIGRR
jgi:hypothetical protein